MPKWSNIAHPREMENRQLEASLQKLQGAADNDDMQPIWTYQSNIRMNTMHSQAIIKKKRRKGTPRNGENA